MDLKILPNKELLEQTHQLAKEERRIGTLILHRLKEITRRRLFATLGYSSTFTYLVQELKYSESCAFRLNNAMKVLATIPEVEPKIASGQLSLTVVAQVQAYCQAQKRDNNLDIKTEEKKGILKLVEGASKREAERILVTLHPQSPLPARDRKRPLASNLTEIKFVAGDELIKKLDRIKNLTAHTKLNPSYSELLDLMAEVVLDKIDPLRKALKLDVKKRSIEKSNNHKENISDIIDIKNEANLITKNMGTKSSIFKKFDNITNKFKTSNKDNTKKSEALSPAEVSLGGQTRRFAKVTRYIPVKTRGLVWARAQGQCCFINPKSQLRCMEKSGLEIEHRIPFAKGGTHEISNLELLCRQHNLLSAINCYGERMRRYVEFG